jgi:hypothetical protein
MNNSSQIYLSLAIVIIFSIVNLVDIVKPYLSINLSKHRLCAFSRSILLYNLKIVTSVSLLSAVLMVTDEFYLGLGLFVSSLFFVRIQYSKLDSHSSSEMFSNEND